MVKYYEVELLDSTDNTNTFNICIKATVEPTKEEAKEFLKEDMKYGYDGIGYIGEISLEHAKLFYNMENEENFPILSR